VLYRRGGRGTPIEAAGSFKTEREAKTRRDLVAGWLAQGRNPKAELATLVAAPVVARSYLATAEAMIVSRHDAAPSTLQAKRHALGKLQAVRPDLAAKPPEAWTVSDVQELVAAFINAGLSPSTVEKYLGDGPKGVLDFAGIDPNPARDRRVRLPATTAAEVAPPPASAVLAILADVADRFVLPIVTLEQTAMRVGELCSLPWGDVDLAGSRFRLSRERTKTRHPRWVQVPGWLIDAISDTCPLEDRAAGRLVFQRVTESSIRATMARACRNAGIPVYSPHDLRHRRASLWHGQGVTLRELMDRGGWKRSEIAIDTYSHVMPLDEIPDKALQAIIAAPPKSSRTRL
jgi:integrase